MNALSAAASFLPLLILFFRVKYIKELFPELLFLVLVSSGIDLINKVNLDYGLNNFFIFRMYTVIEFVALSFFFFKFFKKYVNSLVFYGVNICFCSIAYLDARMHGVVSIDSLPISVESIVLVVCSLLLYYYVLKNLLFDNLLQTSVFWINTAVLIYFSGNLFLFVFSDYLMIENKVAYNFLWSVVHSLFNVLYNVILSIGFWKTKRV